LVKVLIIQHYKENRRKCTVTPLRDRPDLELQVLRPGPAGYPPFEIEGGIVLRVDGPPLTAADRAILEEEPGRRLVLVDCNWAKVPGIFRRFSSRGPLHHRSLPPGIRTAYPRRSKLFQDPPGGLATVEAIAAALAILRSPDPSILAGYLWAGEFLRLNPDLFAGWEREPIRGSRALEAR
jgi:pre-rRNA-processing protein TSR3